MNTIEVLLSSSFFSCGRQVPNASESAEEADVRLPPVPSLLKERLRMKTNVSMVSSQYVLGTYFTLNLRRAILSIVCFLRSTMSFCCGSTGP